MGTALDETTDDGSIESGQAATEVARQYAAEACRGTWNEVVSISHDEEAGTWAITFVTTSGSFVSSQSTDHRYRVVIEAEEGHIVEFEKLEE